VELTYGDELEVYIVDSEFEGTKKEINIPKVYEDENILVVNKPQDIEVEGENSITFYLKKQYQYIEPCHRIDRNTICLVLFAKNEDALNQIIDMFKNQSIEKHYIACCYGIPKSNATIN
jgi:23S rRNA-/tRNA-specific pseudouridylate synthase